MIKENQLCPCCKNKYSKTNPAKKLFTCEHALCKNCLQSELMCPVDKKRIFVRKYGLQNFPDHTDIMKDRSSGSSRSNSPVNIQTYSLMGTKSDKTLQRSSATAQNTPDSKMTTKYTRRQDSSARKTQPKYQICLLHSKQADLICREDSCFICSSCALFGQHKGHQVINYDKMVQDMTTFTEQALDHFENLKAEGQATQSMVSEYLETMFKEKRVGQVKNIRTNCMRMMDVVRKVEKNAIANLDLLIKVKKEEMMVECSMSQMISRKKEYFKQVEELGFVMDDLFNLRRIDKALVYIDEKSQKSYLAKQGEYLLVEMQSMQKMIKAQIDKEVQQLGFEWDFGLQKIMLENFCGIKLGDRKMLDKNQQKKAKPGATINNKAKEVTELPGGESSLLLKSSVDQLLLAQIQTSKDITAQQLQQQQQPQQQQRSDGDMNLYKAYRSEKENEMLEQALMGITTSSRGQNARSVSKSKKMKSAGSSKKLIEDEVKEISKSQIRQSNSKSRTKLIQESTLVERVANKKGKKLELPEKYRQLVEDIGNDRCELADFGGAELGDQAVLQLCELFVNCRKLRVLKLFKNRINDDIFGELIYACRNINAVNLGQNNLTDKTLQYLTKCDVRDLGQLKYITLSLNKINARTARDKVQQLRKKGIIVSI